MILIDKPMPKACDVCPCMYDYIACHALKDDSKESLSACDDYTKRQEWCPLKELVRCKDCKWQKWADADSEVIYCGLYDFSRDMNWFCADGVPKDR